MVESIQSFLADLSTQAIDRVVVGNGQLRQGFLSVDRYPFDSYLLKNGYFQVDSTQDAHYYGTWVNLKTLEEVVYVEGDVYYITFDNEEGLSKNIVDDTFRGIDGGLKEENIQLVKDFCSKYGIENYK